MTDLTNRRAYLGAQNDAWFIIHGEPPAQSNDHPRHDADRVAIAKVLDEQACRRLAACWNVCEGFSTELLEHMQSLGETMLTRFQARDGVEQVLIADRLKFMKQRDALRAVLAKLVDSIGQYDDGDHYLGTDGDQVLAEANRLTVETAEPAAPPAPERCMGGLPQCKWVDVPEGGSKCTACGDTLPF